MKKKLIVIIIVAVVLVALIAGPSLLVSMKGGSTNVGGPMGAGPGGRQSVNDTVYSVKIDTSVKKTLQSYIEVNGDVVAETQVDVYPDVAGKIVSLNVQTGSVVKKNQLIGEVDPSKPGTSYSLSPIYAPIAGTVTSVPLSVGATVSTSTTVAVVGVMDKLEIEAKIPERDVGQLRVGLKAKLTLEAFPGETFDAVVTRVDPVVDATSRSKEIVLAFTKNDPRINAGMFARIKLDTVSYPNRIVVPEEAIVELRGSKYVYVVLSDETVSQREVKTGLSVDDMVEVSEGLNEGETVVIQGQQLLSDGVKVRIVNATGSAS